MLPRRLTTGDVLLDVVAASDGTDDVIAPALRIRDAGGRLLVMPGSYCDGLANRHEFAFEAPPEDLPGRSSARAGREAPWVRSL